MLESDGTQSLLTLYDDTGLIAEMAPGAPDDLMSSVDDFALANPVGDQSRLAVAWVALPCEREPSLTLVRDADEFVLTLDRGNRQGGCESMGLIYGVTLRLSEPVDDSKVTMRSTSGN